MNPAIVPVCLTVFSVAYAVWVIVRLRHEVRLRPPRTPTSQMLRRRRADIMGRSHVNIPLRSHDAPYSQPQTSTAPQTGKSIENRDIFASESVPKHPRQIVPEELDEIFGDVPEGTDNEPLDIDYPICDESFPDKETDADDADAAEDLPLQGRIAHGDSFEQMSEAYRNVVHDNPLTDEKQQAIGHTLLGLKQTDMFEAIVSARPDGNDKVNALIDTYLSAFQRRMSARAAESLSPQGVVPSGFDVRNYV